MQVYTYSSDFMLWNDIFKLKVLMTPLDMHTHSKFSSYSVFICNSYISEVFFEYFRKLEPELHCYKPIVYSGTHVQESEWRHLGRKGKVRRKHTYMYVIYVRTCMVSQTLAQQYIIHYICARRPHMHTDMLSHTCMNAQSSHYPLLHHALPVHKLLVFVMW